MAARVLKRLEVIFDWLLNAAIFLAGVIVVWQTISVTLNTLLRYIFNRPITGVEAITEYGILWLTFLGAAWLLKRDKHIKVDLITNRLNPRTQAIIDTFASVISLALCIILLYYAVQVTIDLWVTRGVDPFKIARFPKAIPVAIIPVGFLLLTIQFIRRLYQDIGHIKKPLPGSGAQTISEESL